MVSEQFDSGRKMGEPMAVEIKGGKGSLSREDCRLIAEELEIMKKMIKDLLKSCVEPFVKKIENNRVNSDLMMSVSSDPHLDPNPHLNPKPDSDMNQKVDTSFVFGVVRDEQASEEEHYDDENNADKEPHREIILEGLFDPLISECDTDWVKTPIDNRAVLERKRSQSNPDPGTCQNMKSAENQNPGLNLSFNPKSDPNLSRDLNPNQNSKLNTEGTAEVVWAMEPMKKKKRRAMKENNKYKPIASANEPEPVTNVKVSNVSLSKPLFLTTLRRIWWDDVYREPPTMVIALSLPPPWPSFLHGDFVEVWNWVTEMEFNKKMEERIKLLEDGGATSEGPKIERQIVEISRRNAFSGRFRGETVPFQSDLLSCYQDAVRMQLRLWGYSVEGDAISMTGELASGMEADQIGTHTKSIIQQVINGVPDFVDEGEYIGVTVKVYRLDDEENTTISSSAGNFKGLITCRPNQVIRPFSLRKRTHEGKEYLLQETQVILKYAMSTWQREGHQSVNVVEKILVLVNNGSVEEVILQRPKQKVAIYAGANKARVFKTIFTLQNKGEMLEGVTQIGTSLLGTTVPIGRELIMLVVSGGVVGESNQRGDVHMDTVVSFITPRNLKVEGVNEQGLFFRDSGAADSYILKGLVSKMRLPTKMIMESGITSETCVPVTIEERNSRSIRVCLQEMFIILSIPNEQKVAEFGKLTCTKSQTMRVLEIFFSELGPWHFGMSFHSGLHTEANTERSQNLLEFSKLVEILKSRNSYWGMQMIQLDGLWLGNTHAEPRPPPLPPPPHPPLLTGINVTLLHRNFDFYPP